MGFVAEALAQIKTGDYHSAAKTLEEHVNDVDLKADSKVNIMEWIGECYSKCDEPKNSALWYERSGRLILESKEMPSFERNKKAIQDFEKAMESCKVANDVEGIKRLAGLKYAVSSHNR